MRYNNDSFLVWDIIIGLLMEISANIAPYFVIVLSDDQGSFSGGIIGLSNLLC